MSALPKKLYTLEEYLELDKNSEEKYEFFDGEIFAMAGGSLAHNTIAANVIRALGNKLEGTACRALTSDMRLKVPLALPYRYPDATVVCGEPVIEDLQGQQVLLNPQVIIEVLSPTTEAYDLGKKFSAYQSIASFCEYVLIAQDRAHVIQYVRQADGKWLRSEHQGVGAVLELESLGIRLALRDIYQRVNFA